MTDTLPPLPLSDEQINELAVSCWHYSPYAGNDGRDFDHREFARAILRAALPAAQPVAWMWEYIGADPMRCHIKPCARSLHEMDPAKPPYPDSWKPIRPLYAAPVAAQQEQPESVFAYTSAHSGEASTAPAEAEAWDFAQWRRELGNLIEDHYDASTAAKHRAMETITRHIDAAGMHWRAITILRDMEQRAASRTGITTPPSTGADTERARSDDPESAAAPQRDNCELCHGTRGGVPGNENRVDGKVICDYCHAAPVAQTLTDGVEGIDGPRHGPAADGSQKPNDAAAIPCVKAGSNPVAQVVYGSPEPKPPCTVCGTPYEKHGTYPTCASHHYTSEHQ
jgi:hypothetical protein